MALYVAGSEDKGGWWLVVATERDLTARCTVSLGLLPQIQGVKGVGEAYQIAQLILSPHLSEEERLLVFMYNPTTSGHIPFPERVSADPQAQAKFLDGFPWINSKEELPGTEQFLMELGMEPHFLNRRLASMAERRAMFIDVPVPIYGS